VIHVSMTVTDLGRMRFAYSPLAEVTGSLHMVASGRTQPIHRGWFDAVRESLDGADLALLNAVIPARPFIADFLLLAGVTDLATSIDHQLRLLAGIPADQMRHEIEEVWRGEPMPRIVHDLIAAGEAGPPRLADALYRYWSAAIEPHWREVRAVLDEDVAYRAGELSKGGVGAILADLHHQISVHGHVLRIDKNHTCEQDLAGAGLLLVPSVFIWPNVVFAAGSAGPPTLTYAARGVGKLWGSSERATTDEEALGALLGRSRAAILTCLALPHSTTELALKLGQRPPSVSQHLSVLRRSGLVTSWRSGRCVLYRRTALATSIVEASSSSPGIGSKNAARPTGSGFT